MKEAKKTRERSEKEPPCSEIKCLDVLIKCLDMDVLIKCLDGGCNCGKNIV